MEYWYLLINNVFLAIVSALNLMPGKRTVMHLVPREKLPQLSPDGKAAIYYSYS